MVVKTMNSVSVGLLAILMVSACGSSVKFSGGAATTTPISEDATSQTQPKGDEPTGEEPIANQPNVKKDPSGEPAREPEVLSGEILIESPEDEQVHIDIAREFISGSRRDGKVEVDIVNGTLTQELTLRHAEVLSKNERNFEQISKPPVAESFKQGTPGTSITDDFNQTKPGLLDILVVIDNSRSMKEEQTNLATKLSSLLSKVGDSDWQIGVITTDPSPSQPCLRGLIKKGDAAAQTLFSSAVNAGTAGDGNEQGVLMAAFGLGFEIDKDKNGTVDKCSTTWLRPNSSLAVLIVSDEDNCSTTTNGVNGCKDNPWGKISFLTDRLAAIRTISSDRTSKDANARVYGLFSVPGTACASAAYVGYEYQNLVNSTGGVSGSICDANYGTALTAISTDVASILKSQFTLTSAPDQGSLKVFVNNTEVTAGFSVMGTTLSFNPPPAIGSTIKVSYVVGATTIHKDFVVQEIPAPGSVTAMINGAAVNPADFTVDMAAKTIRFNTAPVANSEVRILYRKEVALPRTFEIGKRAIPSSIKAKVDNAEVTVEGYDDSTGIVTLAAAPGEKAKVQVSYDTKEIGDPITKFPFTTPWKTVRDLQAKDKISGDNIQVSWANDVLSVDPNAFAEGRVIVITYRDESAGPGKMFGLSHAPIDGKVMVAGISADNSDIACSADEIKIDGLMVQTACDLSEAAKVVLTYKYDVNLKSEFLVSEVTNPASYKWSVFVNGILSIDFVRTGNLIKFASPLPGGTKVKVVAKYNND